MAVLQKHLLAGRRDRDTSIEVIYPSVGRFHLIVVMVPIFGTAFCLSKLRSCTACFHESLKAMQGYHPIYLICIQHNPLVLECLSVSRVWEGVSNQKWIATNHQLVWYNQNGIIRVISFMALSLFFSNMWARARSPCPFCFDLEIICPGLPNTPEGFEVSESDRSTPQPSEDYQHVVGSYWGRSWIRKGMNGFDEFCH